MSATLIQLFARPPVEGKVKTRLIPDIGARNALAVYRHCLDFTLSLVAQSGFDYQVWLSEQTESSWGVAGTVKIQHGENLGERMWFAMSSELHDQHPAYQRVILIGSDCLDLSPAILRRVDAKLDRHELVIIPATDGGYVLIAARNRISPHLFHQIEWGTSHVLVRTLERAMEIGIDCHVLNPLRDIDRVEDLQHYAALRTYL